MQKTKILVLSDNPLAPSGVGIQTRYMIESLLETGRYSFICLGGAIKHIDYRPIKFDHWGDDWVILPVDGYGNEGTVRSIMQNEKPDIVWIMTDPRFWGWLWAIENEVRINVPLVYYHVWDNYPYPEYNKAFYESNDVVATISKVTDDIVRTVAPSVECIRVPHSINTSVYKKLDSAEYESYFPKHLNDDAVVFFWNNRNARRKQSGSLIWWFKDFLEKVGKGNACLVMHTEPKDPNGQDLEEILRNLDLTDGEVLLSTKKVDSKDLAKMYNMADCTINIADAEGFGLATLESLACETPILVTMTGGLQEQVTNGEEWFGIGIHPSSKAIIGSQMVPYIYEDRISKKNFLDAMISMYNMTKEQRAEMGSRGRQHVLRDYNFDNYGESWDQLFQHVREKYGAWESRKNYKPWELREY